MPFRWNDHNVSHLAEHGIRASEAEFIIRQARAPFPRPIGNEKHLIWGQAPDGAYLQVIFIYSPPGVIYVIHARPMTQREKSRFRRQR